MLRVTINGKANAKFPKASTILDALRKRNLDVPTALPRRPAPTDRRVPALRGDVKGWNHHATACNTPSDGMEIETHSPEIEDVRRTLLRLQAAHYPAEAVDRISGQAVSSLSRATTRLATGNDAQIRSRRYHRTPTPRGHVAVRHLLSLRSHLR